MSRQPHLDATPVRCTYAHRPTQRPHCQLTAVVRYANIALCDDCNTRRSTLGKGTIGHRLPASADIDVIEWLTQANRHMQQATTDLAAVVTRARTHGHTWTEIGAALKITKQAAQQRFKQDQTREG